MQLIEHGVYTVKLTLSFFCPFLVTSFGHTKEVKKKVKGVLSESHLFTNFADAILTPFCSNSTR